MATQLQKSTLEKLASETATLLQSIEGFDEQMERAIIVGEEHKKSVFDIHLSIAPMFTDDDGNIDPEKLDKYPRPGSIEKDSPNGLFDSFEYLDNGNKKKASFWRMTAADHPIGKVNKQEAQAVSDGAAGKLKNAYTGLNEGLAREKKGRFTSRFDAFVGKLRDAAKLYYCIHDANTRLAGVVVEYLTEQERDDKGVLQWEGTGKDKKPKLVLADTLQPILVRDEHNASKSRPFSVANFLRLDVEKALLAGDGYENFITSNARGAQDPEGDGIEIENIGQMESAFAGCVHLLNKLKSTTAGHKALIQHFKGAGKVHELATVYNLAELLTAITEDKALKKIYEDFAVNGPEADAA
jgi:hypothetical protein